MHSIKRHIYPALVVWWSLGVTRCTDLPLWWYVIQSDSLTVESTVPRPFVYGRPVSPTHSTRTVSLSFMHVHARGIETIHISRFDGMSASRIHSPSNPSCLAPCLWSPVSPITHPVQSLCPRCMYIGERHTWRLVLPFDLRSYRIQTNSTKRPASFALLAF